MENAPEPEDFESFLQEAMVLDGKVKALPVRGENAVAVVEQVSSAIA